MNHGSKSIVRPIPMVKKLIPMAKFGSFVIMSIRSQAIPNPTSLGDSVRLEARSRDGAAGVASE